MCTSVWDVRLTWLCSKQTVRPGFLPHWLKQTYGFRVVAVWSRVNKMYLCTKNYRKWMTFAQDIKTMTKTTGRFISVLFFCMCLFCLLCVRCPVVCCISAIVILFFRDITNTWYNVVFWFVVPAVHYTVSQKWDLHTAQSWRSCTVVSLLQRKLACDILMTLAIKCIHNFPPHLIVTFLRYLILHKNGKLTLSSAQ